MHPDASEHLLFGATTGIGVQGWSAAIGAPGDIASGSVYILDTEFQRFRFKAKLFVVDEGAARDSGVALVDPDRAPLPITSAVGLVLDECRVVDLRVTAQKQRPGLWGRV